MQPRLLLRLFMVSKSFTNPMDKFDEGERDRLHGYVSLSSSDHTPATPSPHFVNKDDCSDYPAFDEDDSDWLDIGFIDVEADAESMREEAKTRMRTKSNDLRRFHDKICMRVAARERQNRLEAQRAQKHLDEKYAKLFATTEATEPTGKTQSKRLSAGVHFQRLKQQKRAVLKDSPLEKQIEQCLRLDAQIRDDLLRSTTIPRSQNNVNNKNENDASNGIYEQAESPVLLPEQRIALYATVRRQYMEMNRAKVQNNVWQGSLQTSRPSRARSPLSNASIAAAVSGSRARRADNTDRGGSEDRCVSSAGVKIVDMTAGCDVRVHRQITVSSTPWRKKKTTKGSAALTSATEHERFIRALEAQVGAPSLCSCAKAGSSSSQSCANNCALYKQPKKREKLLACVYKQQQQDITTAASPNR